jgi:hypothetical protein
VAACAQGLDDRTASRQEELKANLEPPASAIQSIHKRERIFARREVEGNNQPVSRLLMERRHDCSQ